MNRLSVSNIAWPWDADDEALALVADCGYGGIEIAPVKVFGPLTAASPGDISAYREKIEQYGLKISAMQGILFGASDVHLFRTDAERENLANALYLVAEVAGRLGGVPCVFGAPQLRVDPVPSDGIAFEIAVDFFQKIAPHFARCGSVLSFEPVPAIYDCNFATTTAQAIALVETVAAPGFGLQFDTGAVLANQDPLEVIEQAASMACHLHISEPHLGAICDPAKHQAVSSLVASSMYDQWVSVEMRQVHNWRDALVRSSTVARAYVGGEGAS